jgi:phosphoenolpyruvate---glycerone phosphotransferase subunit DhaL
MQAILDSRAAIAGFSLPEALRACASIVLSTVGGSSGPLLASLLGGMAVAYEGESAGELSRMFSAGVTQMSLRGKCGIGCKTMMDVLMPVAGMLSLMAQENRTSPEILHKLPMCAVASMLATREMIATKGRASFLGERSRGHIDPGAASAQVMISAVCAHLSATSTLGGTAP